MQLIAAAVTILSSFILPISFFAFNTTVEQIALIYTIASSILLFVFLILLVWQSQSNLKIISTLRDNYSKKIANQGHVYSRKSRYAEAIFLLRSAIHTLRDAAFIERTAKSVNELSHKKGEFDRLIKDALKDFSCAMTMIVGVKCRACIKRLYFDAQQKTPDERSLYVETFMRDTDGKEPDPIPEKDWISDNSDYLYLFREFKESCFFSNNLLELQGYANSHWTKERRERGDVDYISTMVWPIRKELEGESSEIDTIHKRQDLYGFLCIDSESAEIFDNKHDTQVGAIMADILYTVLSAWDARLSATPINETSKEGN